MNSSRLNGIFRRPALSSSGLLTASSSSSSAFGKIRDDDFDRAQHGEPAQRAFVQIFADGVFQNRNVRESVEFCDANIIREVAQCFRRHAATTDAADSRHSWIVPAGDEFFFDELHELAFAQDRITQIEPREFVLFRQRTRQTERFSRIQS